MEILLTKPVEKLGKRGEIVYVADGYARNYLLPQGYAVVATKGAKRQAEQMQRAEEKRETQRRDAATAERDKLHGKTVTVRARATAQGRLYGSVSAREICEALRQTHGINEDPSRVQLDEPLRDVGTFTVAFRIYQDIEAEVEVTVKAIEEPGAEPAPTPEPERAAPKPKPIITESAIDDRE